jgi:hypothetical protein
MLSPFDVYFLPSVDQKNGIPFDGFEMAAIVHPLRLLAAFLNDFFIEGRIEQRHALVQAYRSTDGKI